jgi:radical SAM superfamily enzyme YgiQ (UPF0313 family)
LKKTDVVFIAREEYNNLGVGYLSAVLRNAGYSASVIDLSRGKRSILRFLKNADPLITGFSVISYGYIAEFTALVKFLRANDISCHFTSGGHYSSLNTAEMFELIPELDSIVRFEGEKTIVELAGCIRDRNDYRNISGLAYIDNGTLRVNSPRPLERDLDAFPFPVRNRLKSFFFGSPMATILAGRGCMNDCSFCNTREFYREAGGPLKRIRQPGMVVKEMKSLYKKRNCGIFMFMDDDFPVSSKKWVGEFCSGLDASGLSGSVLWKICCRPDEVHEDQFRLMKAHGLFLVFLGIEDGTSEGLKEMNKRVTPDQIKQSVTVLKKLKIGIDYGFMLFNPLTTFDSLDKNLEFLEYLCGDGYMPATFLRMIPIYKTRVEKALIEEGRYIPGVPPGYEFYEDSMNRFNRFIEDSFSEWLLQPYGLSNLGRWIRNYYVAYSRLIGTDDGWRKQNTRLTRTLRDSNRYLIKTLKELASVFKSGSDDESILMEYRHRIDSKHRNFSGRLQESYNNLYYLTLKNWYRKYQFANSNTGRGG